MPFEFKNYNDLASSISSKIIDFSTSHSNPVVVGIAGLQGSGKTTLVKKLAERLNDLGHGSNYASIDDFYYSQNELVKIIQSEKLITQRGVPGTHDLTLLSSFVNSHLAGNTSIKPIYDKGKNEGLGDRVGEVSLDPQKILLLEGWFLGADPSQLQNIKENGTKALSQLNLRNYLPTWDQVDLWFYLDFSIENSKESRSRAEIENSKNEKSKLNISEFLEYMWAFVSKTEIESSLAKRNEKSDLTVIKVRPGFSGTIEFT